MASVAEELNPPDLLSSVSAMNPSPDSEDNKERDDPASDMNAKDADLLHKITNLHCPFIWKPEDSLNSYNSDSVEEIMNVDEVFDEASGFKLRKFVFHLISCYNNFGKRLIAESLKNLEEMEKMLLISMKNKSQDVYFTQINDALFHILHSCRVVMLHSTNQIEKAVQVLKKVTPFEALNPTNQAGVWAVRANLYVEFGYEGIKAAIQYIDKATKIDGDNPQWHFLKGMYLGRLRRMESILTVPSMEEIASLELAMKLKEDAAFMAFAAEVYVETVNRSKKKSQLLLSLMNEEERQKFVQKNDQINEHAAFLFKKSVDLNKNSAHLLFRCGKGMLKLVPPHQDIRLARKYLEHGLEIAYESSFGNHAMAVYYMKHEEDFEKAKKYLIKACESKNFGAEIDLIRVNFMIDQDPEELINSLLDLLNRYNDKMKHRKILAEVESYYLFIKYNLMEAIRYMNQLLYLIGDHDDIISTFKSGILRQKFPVSLLEILISDITDRSNKGKLNDEEQEECRKFMQRLCFQNVTLPRPKNENLRKKFIKEIHSNFKEFDARKIKSSSSRTAEKPVREDYNPVERRFDKQYAKKYYEEDESSKHQKTVVDEFFEKYEAALEFKSKRGEHADSRKDVEEKSKESKECLPALQRLFNKIREPSKKEHSSDENEDVNEKMIDKIAKQLDFKLSVTQRSAIFNKISRSENINDGASTSRQKDHFKVSVNYRRRSSRSPTRRSKSRESRRTGKESSYSRSVSRESYRSTNESYRRRSPSSESRYSTRHSHRRRSPSRESRRRSRSRDERRSHKNRSLSKESYVSTKEKRALKDRPESREDYKSSRRRSRSREDNYAVKSNRRRSSSRESESTSGAERRSRKEQSSSKGRKIRSESRESIGSRKESIRSREDYLSSREKPTSKRRSMSRDSHRSSKIENSRRERSISKESHRSIKEPRRKRSISAESRRSSKIVNPGRERSISNDSHRRRSISKESHRRPSKVKERSLSKESHRSSRESRQKRSISRESYRASKEENGRRERSISKESHQSRKEFHQKRSSSRESRRSSRVENSQKERSISKESHRSSKVEELPRKERSLSKESYRSSKQSHGKRSTSRDGRKLMKSSSKTLRDRPSPVDYSDSKTISADSDEFADSKERSRGRKKQRSPLPERKKRSDKYKKYESDDTFTESTDSDADHSRKSSKKNYRRDHRRKNRNRSYSSDETRSVRSSSKESSRSERVSSRDRHDKHRRKHFDSPYEDSSSDGSSRSHSKLDKVVKRFHQRSSDPDSDFVDKKSEKEKTDDKVVP